MRQAGRTWLRLYMALAILLLAVVPHATLAATAGHAVRQASAAEPGHHGPARHDHARATSPAPRHEAGEQTKPPTMPSCCILGCGLLSFFDDGALAVVRTEWRSITPGSAQSGKDRVPEPAERPPRPLPRSA
jgi:hypothetical protein